MEKYPNLFTPVTIRGKVYKNRMIAAPTMFSHASYFIPEMREGIYRMVEERAKGGFAAVSTGEMPLNFEEAYTRFQLRAIDFKHFYGQDFDILKEYADRIREGGALSYFEFSHEGSRAEEAKEPWGPEDWIREDGVKVKGMNEEMMEKVCEDFYTISRFAKECGFDGVLVHGGHGFLFQQFISPMTNHRTDKYGGSIENRSRFPLMILDAVRRGIGEDGIIELRFSAQDNVPGGMEIEDTVQFCKQIDGKVDIIQVSNGLKWLGNQTQTFSDFFDPHGVNIEYAEKVKKAVKISKVATIGGFNSPEQAEAVIAEGKADFVEFGRQCFADPDLPKKTLEGKEDFIRKCVRCFNCYPGFCEHPTDVPLWEKVGPEEAGKIYFPPAMGKCAINPKSGFLFFPENMPVPESSKNVLIIGGGVGGLQAAITAAERKHKVTLLEKSNRLGGTINFTDTDEDKIDLRNFKNLLIKEATTCGADIRLNSFATPSMLEELNPDAVIICVGATPIIPRIEGIETSINALDVYDNMDSLGKNVVMVGGGLVGCEVGLHLAQNGHNVTVIEMLPTMANETFGYYRNALLCEMDKRGIKQLLGAKCCSFTKEGVVVEQDGKKFLVEADSTCFSMGMIPNSDMVSSLKQVLHNKQVWVVGDCNKAGKVADAVKGGFLAAMEIL